MDEVAKLYEKVADGYNEDEGLEDDDTDHPVEYTEEELKWLAHLDRELAEET